jgi:phosphoenolpyruvate-protein phosphotransferase
MAGRTTPLIIHGKGISPGLAEGITFLHRDRFQSMDAPVLISRKDVDHEVSYLERSIAKITLDLLALATRVEQEMDSSLAAVFDTHQLILNDPGLKMELQAEIQGKLINASSAVKAVFLRWEKRFLLMKSLTAQHKGADMRDISNRLSNSLDGIISTPLERLPHGCVLVASQLLPSDTEFMAQRSTAAVLLEFGRSMSHAILFTRAMGLPCITGIRDILNTVPANVQVLVDADKGDVVIQPRKPRRTSFQIHLEERRKAFALEQKQAREPAITLDGTGIAVLSNVGNREDTERAMANGADGIGLYRTEQAYLRRATPPDTDELLKEMRHTLEPAAGKPVCVRLLDAGADKQLPFLWSPAETNPSLGKRGVRLLLAHPQLLETQMQAILGLVDDFDVSILIPMVTLPQDVSTVRDCLVRLMRERGTGTRPRLGAMIETPAAALSIKDIAPHVDFLSFGTNDLTQYAFAADRENTAVDPYFDDSSNVIFRLLHIVHADAPLLPKSICGELGGRTAHLPRLLQCGIRAFSVVPPLIPGMKAAIRSVRIE